MAKIISPRKQGIAEITHYTVTKLDVLRESMHGGPAEEGTVAVLRINGKTMMSDTRHEKETNYEFKLEATGHVLVAGLGIGMILHPVLSKPDVDSVTVLEKEQDVIDLVAPTLRSPKLSIIRADVFDWTPPSGAKYDCIYFDIWADGANEAVKNERRRLGQRYRKFKADGAWVSYWRPMEIR